MADEYLVEQTFLDITDTSGLAAGETRLYRTAATAISPNTLTASSTTGDKGYELVQLAIVPPRNSKGQYEDLRQVWLILDGKPIQHYINIPGWGWTLMTPVANQVWGGPTFKIPFGMPFWQTVQQSSGHPILNTTLKFSKSLQVAVSSVYGVSSGAAGGSGYRIIGKGYKYSAAALANLGPKWNDTVHVQTTARAVTGKPALSFTYSRPGPIALDTWTALPGGQNQTSTKVNPYWRFAFNGNPTQPQASFSFSTHSEVAGADGNVEDTFQDLGLVFAANLNALILRGYGVRGVPVPPGTPVSGLGYPTSVVPAQNLARAGWWIDATLIPEEMGNQGLFLTAGLDEYTFGAVQPQIALDNLYQSLRKFTGEGLLIFGQNAVPFIGGNGSPVPAYSVVTAYNGVLIER